MKKVITVAVLLASGSVFASKAYDALDVDKSGTISQEEAAAMPALVDQWGKLDGDADGQLTVEEFSAFETSGAVTANEAYDQLDVDKSGTISQEEAAATPALTDQWGKIDGDADGQLTPEEFSAFEAAVPEESTQKEEKTQ